MRKYYFLIAALVFILDQVAKSVIQQKLPLNDSIGVIPGFFRISHVQNYGAAFGLFADSVSHWKVVFLVGFSLLAMAVVAYLLWKNTHAYPTTGIALALILGGAMGNLYDRLADGYVVDFLAFFFGRYHWPDFNVADSAIVVGAVLLVAEILFTKPPEEEHAGQARR
ncbi:MAG TPA: signal peptidase II [Clostridia bacterium]|nr:signal peptidase II [Clostridia bacterium]